MPATPRCGRSIPPVLSVFSGFTLSPAAETLVTAETPQGPQPMVVTQRFGQGKVTAILTDSLWRWQLGPEAGKAKPYERFWTQLISWLLPREESLDSLRLELFADRDQLYLGESLELHARLGAEKPPKPDTVEARVTLPDDREVPYRMAPQLVTLPSGKSFPGFALPFTAEAPGLYKIVAAAKIKGETVTSEPFSFFVKPYSPETVPRPARVEYPAGPLAGERRPVFRKLDALNEGSPHPQAQSHRGEERRIPHALARMAAGGGLMLLLAGSWALRKFRNMP